MFEKEYRHEMSKVQASESLISDTLQKMKAEQDKLQTEECVDPAGQQGAVDKGVVVGKQAPSEKRQRARIVRIFVPAAAACLVVALLGVVLIPQFIPNTEQDSSIEYVFQPVEGSTSIMGDIQFGNIGEQAAGIEGLKLTESSKDHLPEGILEGSPVVFWDHSVFLGYDEQQNTYYAAYQEESSDEVWAVLHSTDLEKSDFIDALRAYFAQ